MNEKSYNIGKNLITVQKLFGFGTNTADKVFRLMSENNQTASNDILSYFKRCKSLENYIDKIKGFDISYSENVLKLCDKNNINILTVCDGEYPERLKSIENPPLVLFCKGKLPDFDKLPSITIVGPRKVTLFGAKSAYSLGCRVAKAGMIVVSGTALGADSYAHKGALKGNGITVGVLGCGILSDYLPENKELRDRISKDGCLITEYHPNDSATKYTFPMRNRIMSGLSLGTVVVEAGERSGALITARHANEQGRDVFVIPGNPTEKCYKGSNALLRDGAKPLLDTSDIFNEYILQYPEYIDLEKAFKPDENAPQKKSTKNIQKNSNIFLSNEAKIVYNYLDNQIFTADELVSTGLSFDSILSALTELEVSGLIESLPGGNYKLK